VDNLLARNIDRCIIPLVLVVVVVLVSTDDLRCHWKLVGCHTNQMHGH